jgi:hypothetical protein
MEEKQLELRMYFFVPYNISNIQKSLQAGHAALEYAHKFGQTELFIDFITNWKTWIILNGGTTNEQRDFDGIPSGTLNQIGDQLQDNGIDFSFFYEPDLNNALTALCFICDERVFNKKDYPDFKDYLNKIINPENDIIQKITLNNIQYDDLKSIYSNLYKEWIRLIGGVKNEFLRKLTKDKKLA